MEKTIKEGDIVKASLEIGAFDEQLQEIFKEAPVLMLLLPVIATEIEKKIFEDKEED